MKTFKIEYMRTDESKSTTLIKAENKEVAELQFSLSYPNYIIINSFLYTPKMVNYRNEYEDYLNEIGVSEDDKESNGGRIPDNCKYGTWLRENDPIAFNVGLNNDFKHA